MVYQSLMQANKVALQVKLPGTYQLFPIPRSLPQTAERLYSCIRDELEQLHSFNESSTLINDKFTGLLQIKNNLMIFDDCC